MRAGFELALRGLADLRGGADRNRAGLLHRLAHGELDREPLLEAIGVVPQCRQLGSAVPRDHAL